MNKLLTQNELFNEEARLADLDTPFDRFHDLILAVFQSNVREAYQQYLEYPDKEPNAGLVQNAAAWIHELLMPDVKQRDIAQTISRWIVKEAETRNPVQKADVMQRPAGHSGHLPFM